jgi:cyclophilin family peptidyl-prolyl cis-trans isomerase/HEAT repeat protein
VGAARGVALGSDDIAVVASLLEAADTRRNDTTVVDRALGSSSPFVRMYGARTIGQNAMSSRAGVLRTLVASADTLIAAEAAFALGSIRDTASASLLGAALATAPTVADAAAWSLGELGPGGRAPLEHVMKTGQPVTALPAVLRAAAKLRPLPVALIVPYLEHADVDARRSAAYALTRSRAPSAVRGLLALETRGGPVAPATSPTDTAAEIRSYIARGLGESVSGDSLGPQAIAALTRLIKDPHPHVRVNAVRSLATYDERAREALIPRLRDPDANVRIALAQTLGDVFKSRRDDWTTAWNADTGFTYRRFLLAAAFRSDVKLPAIDPNATNPWQRNPDWRYRAAAAQAVAGGTLADVDAVAAPLLRDNDARVRSAAYGTAAEWADSSASTGKPYNRASLRTALSDRDLFVRSTILGGLRQRARAADASVAFQAWRAAAGDPENDARLSALRVIATAWVNDSASFSPAFRDSLSTASAPADALERAVVRSTSPFRWSQSTPAPARPRDWYVQQVKELVAADVSGHPIRAQIVTDRGTVNIRFYSSDAPLTVANFTRLARSGYYNGVAFHRVVPNFVAQDGDPRGDGSGGPGYAIRDELNRRWYDRGAVGMALSGPDTGGSQYFIAHSPQPHLDGHYTVFGHVTAGYDVLDAIVQGDRILRIIVQ